MLMPYLLFSFNLTCPTKELTIKRIYPLEGVTPVIIVTIGSNGDFFFLPIHTLYTFCRRQLHGCMRESVDNIGPDIPTVRTALNDDLTHIARSQPCF